MVFDVLSRMITQACDSGTLHGINLAVSAPTLTHLFFADDTILFTKDNTEDVHQIIKILNTFTSASGQKINLTKSGIICGCKVQQDARNRI